MHQNQPRHLVTWDTVQEEVWRAHVTAALRHYEQRHEKAWATLQRNLALIFFNDSLRTRTSMEVAGAQLGAQVSTIIPGSGTWGFEWNEGQKMVGDKAEHIQEAIGVLSRYYDAIGVRMFASGTNYADDRDERRMHSILQASTVPIINLESAFYHPCQALADAATLHTHFGGKVQGKQFVLSWAPHPKALPLAVPHSALLMASRLGMQVTIARPEGFSLDEGVLKRAQWFAAQHGLVINETADQAAAFKGADVIYAKSWNSRQRYVDAHAESLMRQSLEGWQITPSLMKHTSDAAFMHCLPVRRGVVVSDAVLDSPHAIHLLQAEFRLYAQKAILEYVWNMPWPT